MAELLESSHEVGEDDVQLLGLGIHSPVFLISALSVVAFVVLTLMFQADAKILFEAIRNFLTG